MATIGFEDIEIILPEGVGENNVPVVGTGDDGGNDVIYTGGGGGGGGIDIEVSGGGTDTSGKELTVPTIIIDKAKESSGIDIDTTKGTDITDIDTEPKVPTIIFEKKKKSSGIDIDTSKGTDIIDFNTKGKVHADTTKGTDIIDINTKATDDVDVNISGTDKKNDNLVPSIITQNNTGNFIHRISTDSLADSLNDPTTFSNNVSEGVKNSFINILGLDDAITFINTAGAEKAGIFLRITDITGIEFVDNFTNVIDAANFVKQFEDSNVVAKFVLLLGNKASNFVSKVGVTKSAEILKEVGVFGTAEFVIMLGNDSTLFLNQVEASQAVTLLRDMTESNTVFSGTALPAISDIHNHALILDNKIYVSTQKNLVFKQFSNGSAIIIGTINLDSDESATYNVFMKFSDYTTEIAEDENRPKLELSSEFYHGFNFINTQEDLTKDDNKINVYDWSFYKTFSGTLIKDNEIIKLTRRGPYFQLGYGASGKNLNYGGSCWLNFSKIIIGEDNTESGHGDWNIDIVNNDTGDTSNDSSEISKEQFVIKLKELNVANAENIANTFYDSTNLAGKFVSQVGIENAVIFMRMRDDNYNVDPSIVADFVDGLGADDNNIFAASLANSFEKIRDPDRDYYEYFVVENTITFCKDLGYNYAKNFISKFGMIKTAKMIRAANNGKCEEQKQAKCATTIIKQLGIDNTIKFFNKCLPIPGITMVEILYFIQELGKYDDTNFKSILFLQIGTYIQEKVNNVVRLIEESGIPNCVQFMKQLSLTSENKFSDDVITFINDYNYNSKSKEEKLAKIKSLLSVTENIELSNLDVLSSVFLIQNNVTQSNIQKFNDVPKFTTIIKKAGGVAIANFINIVVDNINIDILKNTAENLISEFVKSCFIYDGEVVYKLLNILDLELSVICISQITTIESDLFSYFVSDFLFQIDQKHQTKDYSGYYGPPQTKTFTEDQKIQILGDFIINCGVTTNNTAEAVNFCFPKNQKNMSETRTLALNIIAQIATHLTVLENLIKDIGGDKAYAFTYTSNYTQIHPVSVLLSNMSYADLKLFIEHGEDTGAGKGFVKTPRLNDASFLELKSHASTFLNLHGGMYTLQLFDELNSMSALNELRNELVEETTYDDIKDNYPNIKNNIVKILTALGRTDAEDMITNFENAVNVDAASIQDGSFQTTDKACTFITKFKSVASAFVIRNFEYRKLIKELPAEKSIQLLNDTYNNGLGIEETHNFIDDINFEKVEDKVDAVIKFIKDTSTGNFYILWNVAPFISALGKSNGKYIASIFIYNFGIDNAISIIKGNQNNIQNTVNFIKEFSNLTNVSDKFVTAISHIHEAINIIQNLGLETFNNFIDKIFDILKLADTLNSLTDSTILTNEDGSGLLDNNFTNTVELLNEFRVMELAGEFPCRWESNKEKCTGILNVYNFEDIPKQQLINILNEFDTKYAGNIPYKDESSSTEWRDSDLSEISEEVAKSKIEQAMWPNFVESLYTKFGENDMDKLITQTNAIGIATYLYTVKSNTEYNDWMTSTNIDDVINVINSVGGVKTAILGKDAITYVNEPSILKFFKIRQGGNGFSIRHSMNMLINELASVDMVIQFFDELALESDGENIFHKFILVTGQSLFFRILKNIKIEQDDNIFYRGFDIMKYNADACYFKKSPPDKEFLGEGETLHCDKVNIMNLTNDDFEMFSLLCNSFYTKDTTPKIAVGVVKKLLDLYLENNSNILIENERLKITSANEDLPNLEGEHRISHIYFKINIDFSNIVIKNVDFKYVDFSNMNLAESKFVNCTMHEIFSKNITGDNSELPERWYVSNKVIYGPTASYQILDYNNNELDSIAGLKFDISPVNDTNIILPASCELRTIPKSATLSETILLGPNVDMRNFTIPGKSTTLLKNLNLTGAHMNNLIIHNKVLLSGLKTSKIKGLPKLYTGKFLDGVIVGRGVNLSDVVIQPRADQDKYVLNELNLSGANFTRSTFKNLIFGNVTVNDINLEDANFENVVVDKLKGTNITLPDKNWKLLKITDTVIKRNSDLPRSERLQIDGTTPMDQALYKNFSGELTLSPVDDTNHNNILQYKDVTLDEKLLFGPGVEIEKSYDLRGNDLTNLVLSDITFRATNTNSKLDFTNSDISKAYFTDSKMENVIFDNCKGHAVSFTSSEEKEITNFSFMKCRNSDLSLGKFIYTNLTGSDFTNSNLTSADFRKANLKNVIFKNCLLFGVNFSGANLENTDFTGANIKFSFGINITGTPKNLPSGFRVINGALVQDTFVNGVNTNIQSVAMGAYTYMKISKIALIANVIRFNKQNLYNVTNDGSSIVEIRVGKSNLLTEISLEQSKNLFKQLETVDLELCEDIPFYEFEELKNNGYNENVGDFPAAINIFGLNDTNDFEVTLVQNDKYKVQKDENGNITSPNVYEIKNMGNARLTWIGPTLYLDQLNSTVEKLIFKSKTGTAERISQTSINNFNYYGHPNFKLHVDDLCIQTRILEIKLPDMDIYTDKVIVENSKIPNITNINFHESWAQMAGGNYFTNIELGIDKLYNYDAATNIWKTEDNVESTTIQSYDHNTSMYELDLDTIPGNIRDQDVNLHITRLPKYGKLYDPENSRFITHDDVKPKVYFYSINPSFEELDYDRKFIHKEELVNVWTPKVANSGLYEVYTSFDDDDPTDNPDSSLYDAKMVQDTIEDINIWVSKKDSSIFVVQDANPDVENYVAKMVQKKIKLPVWFNEVKNVYSETRPDRDGSYNYVPVTTQIHKDIPVWEKLGEQDLYHFVQPEGYKAKMIQQTYTYDGFLSYVWEKVDNTTNDLSYKIHWDRNNPPEGYEAKMIQKTVDVNGWIADKYQINGNVSEYKIENWNQKKLKFYISPDDALDRAKNNDSNKLHYYFSNSLGLKNLTTSSMSIETRPWRNATLPYGDLYEITNVMVYDDINVVNYLTPATLEDLDFNEQEILEYVEYDHKKFRNLDVHLGIKQLEVNQHDLLVIVDLYIKNNDSEVYFDRDVRITFKAEKSVIDQIVTIEQPDNFITSMNSLGLSLKGTKPNCYTTLRRIKTFADIPKLIKTSIDYAKFDFSKTVNGVKTLAPVYEWIKEGRTTEEIVPTITKNSVTIDTASTLNIPGNYDLTYIVTDDSDDSVNIKKMLHIEIKPIDIAITMERPNDMSINMWIREVAANIQPECSVPVLIQEKDENDIPIWVNEIVSNTQPDDTSYEKKEVQDVEENLPAWINTENEIAKSISKPAGYVPFFIQASTSEGKIWIKKISSNKKPDGYEPSIIQKTEDGIPVWRQTKPNDESEINQLFKPIITQNNNTITSIYYETDNFGNVEKYTETTETTELITTTIVKSNINGFEVSSKFVPSEVVIFYHTGAAQTFTVPHGVENIQVEVVGAAGGMPGWGINHPRSAGYMEGSSVSSWATVTDDSRGGKGGKVTAEFDVSSLNGQTLQINVGGEGAWGGTEPSDHKVNSNAYGGGGRGHKNMGHQAGGGASDIRVEAFDIDNRIIVAGGGGASNTTSSYKYKKGGAGGGTNGGNGAQGSIDYLGGLGGSQTSGGNGGTNGYHNERPYGGDTRFNGDHTEVGNGGNGDMDPWNFHSGHPHTGSGGGGGYHGGGAGFTGGGGSSYTDPDLFSNVNHTQGFWPNTESDLYKVSNKHHGYVKITIPSILI